MVFLNFIFLRMTPNRNGKFKQHEEQTKTATHRHNLLSRFTHLLKYKVHEKDKLEFGTGSIIFNIVTCKKILIFLIAVVLF